MLFSSICSRDCHRAKTKDLWKVMVEVREMMVQKDKDLVLSGLAYSEFGMH